MAACTSIAKLTRFVVKISEACGPTDFAVIPSGGKIFTNCVKVTGLNMGDEGTVTVPQWGVNGLMADGQRTLSPLALDFRVEDQIPETFAVATAKLTDYVVAMFANRSAYKYQIEVAVTDRAFKALFIYRFKDCDMKSFKSDDQEIGGGKLGMIMTEFLPNDVELFPCSTASITPRIAGKVASNGSFITC
jgi:hypothetical protein